MAGRLIVFGGLPGVGKSTISMEVAQRLTATWVRVDALEAAMWHAGIERSQPTGIGAYAVAHAVANAQLTVGHDVVIDAVNPVEAARAGWRELAATTAAPLRVIEVICPDAAEHRRRVEGRPATFGPGLHPTWDDVMNREYEPWREPRLTIDATGESASNVARVLDYILGYTVPDSRSPDPS